MKPGVEHVVYTLEDSIFLGGHFYAKSTLDVSLRTSLLEHAYGRQSTNMEHFGAEAILHRLMCHCQEAIDIVGDGVFDGKFDGKLILSLTINCLHFSFSSRSSG